MTDDAPNPDYLEVIHVVAKHGVVLNIDTAEAAIEQARLGWVPRSEAYDLVSTATRGLFNQDEYEDALKKSFQAGKDAMRVKKQQVGEAVDILQEAREFVAATVVWQGAEEWRAGVLERLDDFLSTLTS